MVDKANEQDGINWETVVQGAKSVKPKEKQDPKEEKERGISNIIYAGQEVLGDYLSNGNFGWRGELKQNPALASFLKTFGPYALRMENYSGGNNYYRMRFTEVSTGFLEKILDKIADGYYKNTDLLKGTVNPSADYRQFFPEYRSIERMIENQTVSIDSPLGIVMMMSPEKRPVMAVACKKLSDEDGVQIIKGGNYLRNCLPYIEKVISAAKEYGVTEIRDAISEFNQCARNINM